MTNENRSGKNVGIKLDASFGSFYAQRDKQLLLKKSHAWPSILQAAADIFTEKFCLQLGYYGLLPSMKHYWAGAAVRTRPAWPLLVQPKKRLLRLMVLP
jgi:hypothetical protein